MKTRQNSNWLLFAIIVVAFIALGGQTAKLTCARVEPGEPVNCVRQTSLLWTIPVGEEEIRDVRRAQVGESSYEGNPTYRVELLTAQGTVPLTFGYTSGWSSKREAADGINAFVLATKDKTVVIAEPGIFSAENFFCLLVWLPMAIAWSYLWGKIKSAFGRARGEVAKNAVERPTNIPFREATSIGPVVSCPYCGNSIPRDAIDCVYCQREVYDALHKQ